jgi:outer membrane lipoprotein-sorting protein
MNLKKISIALSSLITVAFVASCNSNTVNQLPIDNNVIINANKADTPQDVIKQFGEAYGKIKDFTGIVTIMDSKTGNTADAVTGDSKFYFKKDRNERVEITKSDDPQKNGTTIAYKGGDKVQVLLAKPIPILGKKFTLSVNDKRVGTSRGLSFNQLDLTAMLNRFNKAGVKLDLVQRVSKNGKNLIVISGKGTFKDLDNEVTEEILTLDSSTMLPVDDNVMVKDKTVLRISLKDLKLDVGLKDDLFTL